MFWVAKRTDEQGPPTQYSLRTLLVAVTLVAVVLGFRYFVRSTPPALPPIDVGDFGDALRPSLQR
jgi:hypothetical protein